VAGVDAHGIKVFDRADDDDVVGGVAHHLELKFLPSQNGFFDQGFVDRGEIQAACQHFSQLFEVVGNAAARAPEGKRWTNDHREANLAGELDTVLVVIDQRRFGDVEADALHGIFEEQPVFGLFDGGNVGADQMDVVFLEHAAVGKLD